MDNFVAIDFETANFAQSSVCSVGLVIVKDGEIVDNYYSLIRPIPNYYNARCSEVNGLHFDDTNDAPEFPDMTNHHHALADAEACAVIAKQIL